MMLLYLDDKIVTDTMMFLVLSTIATVYEQRERPAARVKPRCAHSVRLLAFKLQGIL